MTKKKSSRDPPKYVTRNPKQGFLWIASDMILSTAFRSLNGNQVRLLISMRQAAYRQTNAERQSLADAYNGNPDYEYFYFNKTRWFKEKAGMRKEDKNHFNLYSDAGQFYKDRDALVHYGFIEVAESNRHRKMKNVYRFSDKWSTYTPNPANAAPDTTKKHTGTQTSTAPAVTGNGTQNTIVANDCTRENIQPTPKQTIPVQASPFQSATTQPGAAAPVQTNDPGRIVYVQCNPFENLPVP